MIRVAFLFIAAASMWVALTPADAIAAPSKEWCDSRQDELKNDCLDRFYRDSSKVQQCFRVVNDWYAKCLNGDVDTTSPCLCDLLKPLGFALVAPGTLETFEPGHSGE